MSGFCCTPEPPYWAVIFSSQRTEPDPAYDEMAAALAERVRRQPGCLGFESVRGAGGFGMTVAYFSDEAAIAAWRADSEHREAQRLGKERWYQEYSVRIARIERDYRWSVEG